VSGFGRLFESRRQRDEREARERVQLEAEEAARLEAARDKERSEGVRSLPVWTDSHCHLQMLNDQREVLVRAERAGTRRIVLVGTDAESSRAAIAQAASLTAESAVPVEMWATIGLHPHDASVGLDEIVELVGEVASDGFPRTRVVAIGECGLDYHYDHSPRGAQRSVFAAQVALAHRHSLALVIHTREAWDDTFRVLEAEGVPERTVFHCFSGGPSEAAACLEAGAYVSFSGIVTFKSASEVRDAARATPAERILVETDSPFLTPVPHRGKPNEPAFVPLVGAALAELKEMEPGEMATATTANAAVVFGLHG
jgi:TatD DNase family protein